MAEYAVAEQSENAAVENVELVAVRVAKKDMRRNIVE